MRFAVAVVAGGCGVTRTRGGLFTWPKAARHGRLALPADATALFVPVMMAAQKPVAPTPSITIEAAGIVVRVECGVDVGWLAAVLRVVKPLS